MTSNHQRNIAIYCLMVFAVFTYQSEAEAKSIIRNLLESQAQFAPGRSETTGRIMSERLENCRVKLPEHKDLFGKLERLCDECYQTYRVANFHSSCRGNCFDNEVFRGCTMALFREKELAAFTDFLLAEVKPKGMTVRPLIGKNIDSS